MSGMTKAERLQEITRLYIQRAFTDQELADRMGVNRATIYRDRLDLTLEYPLEQDSEGRYHINRTRLITEIKVNLHEALALYLAARKSSRQNPVHQPHAASALEKLAAALRQPMTERLLQSAQRLLNQQPATERTRIVEILAQAWVEMKKVRIRYKRLDNEQHVNHTVSPYLIEPSIWSDGVYLVALSDVTDRLITFKIDRIETAVLTSENFEIPLDFDDQKILKFAWGIWMGDQDPTTVRLRFSPAVSRRVKESIWHPMQQIIDLPDGGCEWLLEVAEWREMLPWIRGWGADVEVLEPAPLRKALERETRLLAKLYAVGNTDQTNLFYAHTRQGTDQSEWQRLIDHLNNTAKLAAELGRDAGIADLARIAGLTHDLGKYSQAFQRRLEGSTQKVDHSSAGAQEIWRLFGKQHKWQAMILAYAIAGHHTGLPNYGSHSDTGETSTLLARIHPEKNRLQDYSVYTNELNLSTLVMPELKLKRTESKHTGFSVSFLTRMLFSTLVDADWIETETFMQAGQKPRGGYDSIDVLAERLNHSLLRFDNPQNEINQKRSETLHACKEKANSSQGVFTLTVPTGGGKTLASMTFALNHAVKHGLKRVIYVIPFTSIIEQNAAIFKEFLNERNVLEHHSNFDWEQLRKAGQLANDDETTRILEKLKLATENWDIPIVVTTNVQFFESLFSNKKSRCRKLHNLAKSVIIFDEAQTLPREFLKPCMLATQELVLNYGVSAVFCTATQPLLKQYMPDIPEFMELEPNPERLFDFYRRTKLTNIGSLPDPALLEQLRSQKQVLCIVNTRRHAAGLYNGLNVDGSFHLSTLMCPAHRKKVLANIRASLREDLPCRVISTQVIEAGIDIDFPVGYRAMAGIDSIIQAAGRVNREGKLAAGGQMFVFEPQTDLIKFTPVYIRQTADAARSVLKNLPDSQSFIQTVRSYFTLLDTLQDPQKSSDARRILDYLNRTDGFDFQSAADKFKLIDNDSVAIIVPFDDDARNLINQLAIALYPITILRQLQNYTVNVYKNEYEKLNSLGAIEMVADTYAALTDLNWYDDNTGLLLPDSQGAAAVFYE